MENAPIADIFDAIADRLELKSDNPFRIRSYRNAAQSIRSLSDRLEDRAAEDQDLSEIPNIGEATAKKIREILNRGTCARLEDLRDEIPEGLVAIMRIPGVGPRKAMQIRKELGIDRVADLKKACRKHSVRKLAGLGEKTERKILKGIRTAEKTKNRILYSEAAACLDSLASHLDGISDLKRWDVAGSFRRGKETIGDLDILVCAENRKKATDSLLEYSEIADVVSRGKERVRVRLKGGLAIDFRFFDAPAFGAAFMYFTGSKAHNIKVRRMAQERDWKLNEYGLFAGDRRLAGKSEKAVYKSLDLQWPPPELREDRGEVEAARNGRLPRLIEGKDVRGDLQCHTTASDGKHSIAEMAEAARGYGYEYLAITDHSKRVAMAHGLDDEATRRHADAIRDVDRKMKGFWLLAGIEVDILKSGKLDLKEKTLEGLDWVVASLHYDLAMSRKAMTDRIVAAVGSGVVHCLGHPLGRIVGKRDPIAVDMDRVVEACIEHGVRLEINGQPDRLDLPDTYCRTAREAGATFTLGTDAHSADGFHFMPLAVTVARRGWLRRSDVLNTKTAAELRKALRKS
jgi:DNA polymerase (family X)